MDAEQFTKIISSGCEDCHWNCEIPCWKMEHYWEGMYRKCTELQELLDAAIAGQGTLQKALAESQRRERAAIEDILGASITPCEFCKSNPSNGGNCNMKNDEHEMFSCWQWRGPKEGEPHETV